MFYFYVGLYMAIGLFLVGIILVADTLKLGNIDIKDNTILALFWLFWPVPILLLVFWGICVGTFFVLESIIRGTRNQLTIWAGKLKND